MCKSCDTRKKTDGEKITAEVKPNKPSYPICLGLEDARVELFNTISRLSDKYRLPFFLLESTVNDAARMVSRLAEDERKAALEKYEEQLKEGEWET